MGAACTAWGPGECSWGLLMGSVEMSEAQTREVQQRQQPDQQLLEVKAYRKLGDGAVVVGSMMAQCTEMQTAEEALKMATGCEEAD